MRYSRISRSGRSGSVVNVRNGWKADVRRLGLKGRKAGVARLALMALLCWSAVVSIRKGYSWLAARVRQSRRLLPRHRHWQASRSRARDLVFQRRQVRLLRQTAQFIDLAIDSPRSISSILENIVQLKHHLG